LYLFNPIHQANQKEMVRKKMDLPATDGTVLSAQGYQKENFGRFPLFLQGDICF
jgi:hypothetical protein